MSAPKGTGKKYSVRLPAHAVPHKYSVSIKPDLDAFTFTGEEQISLKLSKSSREITLHSAELEILESVYTAKGETFFGAVSYDDANERATLTFETPLPKGEGVLHLAFAGILNDKMRGFYRSRYEHEGEPVHMAVTQFESTDARRAFPCFDEPAHKAVFEVTLIIPSDRTAISNTIETSIMEHEGGYKAVTFAPSPKMSSYLLAFIVGHFEHIETKTKSGTLVRVFTTPGKKHQATFALECAARCIEFYEKYFGIKYPLPTMDLIAIPDFAAGAMENWGAVTYRETTVLVDPEHSSIQNRQRVGLVIAHELAHQWFGNLVTMEWWTHLWLNEGFATYMEYVAIDAVYPHWNIWSHFVAAEQTRGLALDGLANTHAIEIDVNHPNEISEIFDAVSYSKGASVIRMLAAYLGESAFRRGLSHYLKKHQYGNALTEDLWKALQEASGKPVAKMMREWTRKPGYPLVAVYKEKKGLTFAQSRFFADGKKTKDATRWMIPLSLRGTGTRVKPLMLSGSLAHTPNIADLMTANAGVSAFARVAYPPEILADISARIARGTSGLSEAERFVLIRDAFALAKAGALPTDDVLSLMRAYGKEKSYIVWGEITEALLALLDVYRGKPEEKALAAFARTLLAPAVARVGWNRKRGEHEDNAFLRSALIHAAGTAGDAGIIAEAKKRFVKAEKLDPSLRGAVYSIVAQYGGQKEYRTLRSMYASATLEEEKDRIMRALCSFRDTKILSEMLDTAFSENARGQDTLKAMTFSWMNPYGRQTAWSYLKRKWAYIGKRFGGGHLFPRFIAPAGHFNTEKDAQAVLAFFAKQKAPGIERTTAQAVEHIRAKAAWYARDKARVARFFQTK